jgi:NADPH:quinone reductase-like Zn-dependent oxidoreductase
MPPARRRPSICRSWLRGLAVHHPADAAQLRRHRRGDAACADAVFARVLDGTLKVTVAQRYPLVEVQRAHAELQARRTVGSSLLVP